jgi:cytochrome c oxidase subunit I+III
MMIAIPSGVQVFCWIATLWAGRPRFDTPLLFALGFIFLFVLGGLTGVMVASVPFDQQAHDTYFVVAHLHYVQIGAFVFPLFAAFYYWFPKITGRMLSERAGKWNFWLFFTGVNVTFFPMHFLGLMGMTRRIYTYLPETGWGSLNLLSTAGAALIAGSVLLFVVNVVLSVRKGQPAGADPWSANSLEWTTSSPPPIYNFMHLPVVHGRYPLWDQAGEPAIVTGLLPHKREVLFTSVMDAEPVARHLDPEPTIWPLIMAFAVAVTFVTGIFTPWGFVVGPALMFPALMGWLLSDSAPPEDPTFAEEPA